MVFVATPARQLKTQSLTFRVSPADKELLEAAAIRAGSDVTGFVLAPALIRAQEIAAREEVTLLSGAARERFVELVERPPAPSPRLIRNLSDERHQIVD